MAIDRPFLEGDARAVWAKYCGFLDLSLPDFMAIQEQMLRDQLAAVAGSPILGQLLPRAPGSTEEFRQTTPLSTWEDYEAALGERREDVLPVKPAAWAMTSGRSGVPKWIPYTAGFLDELAATSLAVVILACARFRGEVRARPGLRVLVNLPSPPYMTGLLMELLGPRFGAVIIPPPDRYRDADFQTKIKEGFRIALEGGVDLLSSMTSVLIRMGESFAEGSGQIKIGALLRRPRVLARMAAGWLRAARARRPMLPRDLWPLKGLACYGLDTQIYRERLLHYWGCEPFESYGSTETGVLAISSWRKRDLTFLPRAGFLEFLPFGRPGDAVDPASAVTLDRVEPGKSYEVVVTGFHGLPLVRYRLGDVVRFTAAGDPEAGIRLPQAVFESRISDLIEIAGFARIDEKTMTRAVVESGAAIADWSLRKEAREGRPVLRLYTEFRGGDGAAVAGERIRARLRELNKDYRDLEDMLRTQPLEVVPLAPGSFDRYYQARKNAGLHLAHLKPPRMNASDEAIASLVGTGER
jgi:hypothetical protein